MDLKDPSHPIWRIGTILASSTLVLAVNYFNANDFSADDISRIFQTLGGVGAIFGIKSLVTKNSGDPDP